MPPDDRNNVIDPSRTSRSPLLAFGPLLAAAVVWMRIEPLTTLAGLILLTYLPGRILMEITDVGRQWDRMGKIVLSIAISLGVTPVFLNPIWHATNAAVPLLGGITLCACAAGIFALSRRTPDPSVQRQILRCFDQRRSKFVFWGCVVLIALAVIGPYWPTELRGFPMPSLIHDFIKHHAVLFSMEKQPLPLGNPFYADEAAGPVYYYHFFYLIPATLRVWSGALSIELAFGLCGGLLGAACMGLFYLILKRFTVGDGPAMLAALLATVIGGLDIIPLMILRLPAISLDAWADHPIRIHSLLTQMVWSPQNMLAALTFLVGIYVLSEKGLWRGWWALGPLLGSVIFGASPWIAMAVFPGLVLFMIHSIWSRRDRTRAAALHAAAAGIVGLLTAALALPSLWGYLEMSRRLGKGLTLEWPRHGNACFGKLLPPGPLANLLDLPWILAVEMGPLLLFPLFLPRQIWKRVWSDSGLRLLLISAIVAIVGYTTLRSHFTYNDFGQKIMLVALSAGVAFAALIVAPITRPISWWNPCGWTLIDQTAARPRRCLAWLIGIVLLFGMPLGLFQSPLLASRRYLTHLGPLRALATPETRRSEHEAHALRFVRYELPATSVIQGDPGENRLHLAQLARKQIGVTILERDTMVFSPSNATAHERTLAAVSRVLRDAVTAEECRDVLKLHNITHVYVGEVERDKWRGLEKFEETSCFRPVYTDDIVSVYAVE